ncbi:hypothetical protein [Nocardioides aurantiacus]|nr:hypothetical protein [Nocardioides aurantiacus]
MSAPFRVRKAGNGWVISSRGWNFAMVGFETAGDAIDHVYRNWPWWP